MSRLYIRVKTGFYTHRKTVRLYGKIGADAFWLPPRLWAYCAESQPDGNLSGYESSELAMLVGYKGDAKSMLQALKDCGFIDVSGNVHDWQEHNGYHEKYSSRAKIAAEAMWEKKRKEAKEKKIDSDRKGESGDKHCLGDATSIEKDKIVNKARVLLHLLNQETGRYFRESDTSLSPIMARLSEPEVTLEGCQVMLSRMVKLWKGTAQEEFLRPQTLFRKENFNGYYAGKDQPIINANQNNGGKNHAQPDHSKGF